MHRRMVLLAMAASCLAPRAGAQSLDDRDLTRISNYLNGITTLQGNFTQIGPDGDLSEGQFYLRRPGRMRFQYNPPNPALIVADGTWVGIYDTEINTLDRVPLGSTPLDLLLRERVDLRGEGAVKAIDREAGQMRVQAIDPKAPEQGSITMVFADNPLELRQWIILDAQGLTTTVALYDVRANVKLNPELFFINEPQK